MNCTDAWLPSNESSTVDEVKNKNKKINHIFCSTSESAVRDEHYREARIPVTKVYQWLGWISHSAILLRFPLFFRPIGNQELQNLACASRLFSYRCSWANISKFIRSVLLRSRTAHNFVPPPSPLRFHHHPPSSLRVYVNSSFNRPKEFRNWSFLGKKQTARRRNEYQRKRTIPRIEKRKKRPDVIWPNKKLRRRTATEFWFGKKNHLGIQLYAPFLRDFFYFQSVMQIVGLPTVGTKSRIFVLPTVMWKIKFIKKWLVATSISRKSQIFSGCRFRVACKNKYSINGSKIFWKVEYVFWGKQENSVWNVIYLGMYWKEILSKMILCGEI